MIALKTGGMDSSGVLLPDRYIHRHRDQDIKKAKCGIDRAIVARKIPIAVAKNR